MKNSRRIRAGGAWAAWLLLLSCITGCAANKAPAPEQEQGGMSTLAEESSEAEARRSPAPQQTDSAKEIQNSETDSAAGTPDTPAETCSLPELVHSSAADIIRMMGGDYELMPDELPGCFYICNELIFPQTRFYVVDNSFEHIPTGNGSLAGYEQEIRDMLMNSGIEIDKINTYTGGMEIDGYTAGKNYLEYEEKINAESFVFGNLGEYFNGAPASSAYSYTDAEHNAKITLHFELTGDYQKKEEFISSQGAFPAYIMAQDNPKLHLITVSRDDGYPKAEFTAATASSVLAPEANGDLIRTYGPENVLDGDLSTCWAEGVEGLGYGESLTLVAAEPQTVSTIRVYGGLQSDAARFRNNACPTELLAEFDDGSVYRVWVSDVIDYGGVPVFLCSGKKTSSIKLTLQAITAGEQYQDTCISEISFE